jgi:GNAT superfamily N-acetyltransferase
LFCLRFVPVRQVPRLAAYDSVVSSPLAVRPALVEDVAQMARVNVRCWQETYRGLMPDAELDDPGFPAAREWFWTAALTGERYRENRVAVAERDGELIGIAMSGPPLDAGAAWARQLYVLYVHAADHGTGAGPALLEAVVDPEEPAALWAADPNPRAQAFYRKHAFIADGAAQVEDGAGDPHGPRQAAPAVVQFAGRLPPGAVARTASAVHAARWQHDGCELPRVGRCHATEHACVPSAHAASSAVA